MNACRWLQHCTYSRNDCSRSLLLGDSKGSAGSSGGLGLLTSDLVTEEVSETSVTSDLLESFQILSELGVQGVGDELTPVAVSSVSLSVQEPFGNVVLYTQQLR